MMTRIKALLNVGFKRMYLDEGLKVDILHDVLLKSYNANTTEIAYPITPPKFKQ
ncbi:hypothetical protein GCM10023206_09990 [Acinetobacter puyangensis]|uniref:Uncharacterized protein n=1 Tax=Acinetobacter puyangensis TaxID=1096779 RepID=A0A240EBY3_9GAMM|nr:hypothetical protein SAMN05421731_105244 [Acinetobacter puyangensis]